MAIVITARFKDPFDPLSYDEVIDEIFTGYTEFKGTTLLCQHEVTHIRFIFDIVDILASDKFYFALKNDYPNLEVEVNEESI